MTTRDLGPTFARRTVGDVDVFYREAGPRDAPAVLLLHGFPTAGHMFRDLMPRLADRYHLIAPDLPGFGNTVAPPRGSFAYTFDALAAVVAGFVEALGLRRYALYVFDYGAPVGLRLARAHPERVTAIVSQNGNAYEEGLSDAWAPWRAYWADPTDENRDACRASLTPDAVHQGQYLQGADPARVSPDGYTLDLAYLARPRGRRGPTRPDPRLSQQRRALPRLPGLPAGAQAAASHRVGTPRPALPPGRRGGLPPRPARGRGRAARRGTLRPRDAFGRDRRPRAGICSGLKRARRRLRRSTPRPRPAAGSTQP